jgi:hypothetical protein
MWKASLMEETTSVATPAMMAKSSSMMIWSRHRSFKSRHRKVHFYDEFKIHHRSENLTGLLSRTNPFLS